MNTENVISELKKSNLYTQCPSCDREFNISKSCLFDGTKHFPKAAMDAQKALIEELQERKEELQKREKRMSHRHELTKSVNVGKQLEKILPTMRDFKWELPDCCFLGDPIDLITFNGLAREKINSISFIEVKTGHASLSRRQKSIIDAVEDKKVHYKVI